MFFILCGSRLSCKYWPVILFRHRNLERSYFFTFPKHHLWGGLVNSIVGMVSSIITSLLFSNWFSFKLLVGIDACDGCGVHVCFLMRVVVD